ncbi:hypothetical protein ANO14919_050140 [Xylariales sp. No.14919]|nr:hypothetical protein ANO14919_050140 [Xylariales sp. No.14919]
MVHRGKRGGTAHKAKKTGETKNTQKGKGIEKGESTVEAKSTQNTQEAQGTQNAGDVQEVQNTQAAHIKQNVVFAIEMAVVFPRLRDPREAAGLVWTEKAMPVLAALRRLELPGLDIRIKEAHDFTGWSMTRNQFSGIEFNLTLGWNRRENLRLQINFACLFVEAAIFGTKSRISSSLNVRKTEVGRLVKFMCDQRESRLDPDEREALRKLLIVDD